MNKNKLKQRIRYRFPKHETMDQLENVLVIDLETCINQESAEESGLYDVNRSGDRWNRDLTPDEIVIEKDNVIVFVESYANPVMNMLKYISENYEGDERTYIHKD